MSLPMNQVILGDCAEVMQGWPADSIDLVVTSPPYWGLRDYGSETVRVWGGLPECEHEWEEIVKHRSSGGPQVPQTINPRNISVAVAQRDTISNFCFKCGAWRGSLGLEPHPQLFIDHIVEVCREIRRVLKPSGTFWLNLGDTYCGSWGNYGARRGEQRPQNVEKFDRKGQTPQTLRVPQSYTDKAGWLQPKQLLGMPWRVAIALQNDSWILRNDIIWHKPNHMPSSVKDRLTCAYEHVFLFAKQRRYYFDLDAIRQPVQKSDYKNYDGKLIIADRSKEIGFKDDYLGKPNHPKGKNPGDVLSGSKYLEQDHPHSIRVKGGHTGDYTHPRGKNPGDFWSVPTRPFPGAHFATFPPKLIEPIVKAGSPRWICSRCGKPRKRITGRPCTNCGEFIPTQGKECPSCGFRNTEWLDERKVNLVKRGGESTTVGPLVARRTDLTPHTISAGWSDCGCGEKWISGIVMDPFGGSGTVGQVARRLGRRFILIEIIPEYAEMACQRVRGRYKPVPEGVTPFTQDMEAEK